jgi:hypothetical protein
MSAVTYHGGYAPTAETGAKPRKKGLFARILDYIIEARTRQAARQVEMYLGYLPEDLRRHYLGAAKNGK